jgi:hypothetical protein
LCSIASSRLRRWADIVRDALDQTDDLDRITELLERQTSSEFDDAKDAGIEIDMERYETLASMRMNAAGLVRYWKKRADAERGTKPA